MLWIIAVIAITILIVLILCAVQLSKHTFVCKKCGCKTKYKWFRLVFITHYENEYRIDCPQCGGKDMLEK